MQGIVNKAIHGLILENYGADKWEEIKTKSKIEDDFFLSDQSYPDDYTYQIVLNASEILGIPAEKILHDFGEYWILKIGEKHYGSMFRAAGKDIGEFLLYLPHFHNRVMLIYPNIKAPEFLVSKSSSGSYRIEYISERPGLEPFVSGLLSGISIMYQTKSVIELISTKSELRGTSVFEMKILA